MKKFVFVLRWGGLIGCVLLVVLGVYSTRVAVSWNSASVRYGAGVSAGTLVIGWQSPDWVREDDPYAGEPGWTFAQGSACDWAWWIEFGSVGSSSYVLVPLWMLLTLAASVTSVFWYRDRRTVQASWRGMLERLRPAKIKRITAKLIALWTVLHLGFAIISVFAAVQIYSFLHQATPRPNTWSVDGLVRWMVPLVVWASPLWGILWACVYVRVANRLCRGASVNRCFECGYDLTGNVSGRCPECGTEIDGEDAMVHEQG